MSRKPVDPAVYLTGYASPPCYATDFPGHFGEKTPPVTPPDVLIDLLNALLEAERAGAKVLAILRDTIDPRLPVFPLLARLQTDEGRNAVILYKTIHRLGGVASHETGAFVAKTIAIDGLLPRLAFINRGQAWVVRKIDEALGLVEDEATRQMLQDMRQSHEDNIAACAVLLGQLAGERHGAP
ncbi:DUF6306 domain-containing protein [Zoogloea sp.]|uniref:DUF6306 domain-containing protein n=1 Tax=Zoogloea sp. TaxID=49181 RepID=UPI00262C3304|nr:DUF6306 domain-containing protein [Zoogloea sp.]MDD3352862.1 DUF6306 domain-containing protein [Zoogloea sp.]